MKQIFAIIALIFITACSGPTGEKIAKATGFDALRPAPVVLAPDTMQSIDQLAGKNRDVIRVRRPNTDGQSDMVAIADNNGYRSYTTTTRQTITLRSGVIVQTQGFGQDLAAFTQTTFNLLSDIDAHTRVHKFLNGEREIETMVFRCIRINRGVDEYGAGAQKQRLIAIDENCRNEKYSYDNLYFIIPGTNSVARSKQWISPEIEYLRVGG
ncbi:hypothetical protein GCM10008927_25870 [Amylibacter ulvae]|uniref:Group 4 capsule polysaccharide lipoprotein gfcB, YjbF n=1 Tax=Paramylibacter ulvae TaxID=1651968 RepID=A0ABQ3D4X1_9RHOB|nr:YjbF family lipoprotein [Amylibacter ulvae]GHA59013.1 hypothetical protein GCM10008927_25870 [Amylibacter ulvae]